MVSKRVESLLNQLRTQGIVDERVLEAITLVPRYFRFNGQRSGSPL